ncbi:MAG: hypothetical protein ACRCVI_02635 [Mycoplasmoidaceae bacterium]
MKQTEFDGKTVLAITVDGAPLLDVHESQKKRFYELILLLSKKYKLILVTDIGQFKSPALAEDIGLKDGFIINNCGSSIYNIKTGKIIYVANIKKSKLLAVFRQVLIAGDSVIIHTHKKIYIYTYYIKLFAYIKNLYRNTAIELIEDYDYGIKNLMRNKVESLELINTFYDFTTIDFRNEKIHSICEYEDLIYNEITNTRILVIDSSINDAIEFIMESINMKYTEVYLINLTNIFHNQNITSSYEVTSNIFMEQVFYDRTFFMLENEFKNILIENNFITEEESE